MFRNKMTPRQQSICLWLFSVCFVVGALQLSHASIFMALEVLTNSMPVAFANPVAPARIPAGSPWQFAEYGALVGVLGTLVWWLIKKNDKSDERHAEMLKQTLEAQVIGNTAIAQSTEAIKNNTQQMEQLNKTLCAQRSVLEEVKNEVKS